MRLVPLGLGVASFAISALLLTGAVAGGEIVGTVVPDSEVKALQEELSGLRAKEYVWAISQYDRIQASEGWVQAAEYVRSKLAEVGLEGQIESFPSDGERRYYTWTPPMGWKIRRAELWLLEPEKRKLADYRELPTSVAKGSQSADVTAEVVPVSRGTRPEDYEGIDVKGKIVLADGYAGDVHREAVLRRGAAGVITYLPRQDRMEFPDFIPYHGLWIRKREQPRTTFGFTISRRTAEQLLSWLKQGKRVRVRAVVDGEDYPSQIRTLTCVIPGKRPDQEILFVAHLDHYKPGAIDNASGSAALLELACSLKRLIDEGQLPQPVRSIRFLWVSEWYGTVPWIQAHHQNMRNVVAGFNLDMVGGDFVATRSYFAVIQTPWSRPSFVNDLCAAVIRDVATLNVWCVNGSRLPFNYRLLPYSGGSDHWMFNDATVGVPMPMFFQPDYHHHTVQDIPDHVDPTEMERVLLIAALCARSVAWANQATAIQLAHLTASGGEERLSSVASRAMGEILNAAERPQLCANLSEAARNKLKQLTTKEKAAVQSVLELNGADAVDYCVVSLLEEIESFAQKLLERFEPTALRVELGIPELPEPQLPASLRESGDWVPARTQKFVCPVAPDYLRETVGPEALRDARLGDPIEFEVANFMDGERTLRQIWDALRAEFDHVDYDRLVRYVLALEKAGLVEIRR